MRVNELAAYIHDRMCNDERFGYSWEERYGADPEVWHIDGRDYVINIGDYECGTSVKTAWAVALQHTPYEGCLDGYVYTGNAIDTFCGSGLFDWMGMDFLAEPGDAYLNIENHMAMCQSQYPDVLSEFSWGENGAYGNQRGDQTGWESSVHGYYDYPWDGILHYNGKADGTQDAPSDSRVEPSEVEPAQPEWQGDVVGKDDTTGAMDDFAGVPGRPVLYIAIDGVGEYQAHDLGKPEDEWWPKVDRYDLGDEEEGMAGSGNPLDGLRIFDPTVHLQVHDIDKPITEWHEVMVGTEDTSPVGDDYAGEYGHAFDLVRIWREEGEQPRYNVYS